MSVHIKLSHVAYIMSEFNLYYCLLYFDPCNMLPLARGSVWEPPGRAQEGPFEVRGEMSVASFRNAVFGQGCCVCGLEVLQPLRLNRSQVSTKFDESVFLPLDLTQTAHTIIVV